MKKTLPLLGIGALFALMAFTQVSCVPEVLDFNGSYLFTLAYEDGFEGVGYVTIAQEDRYVEIEMELPHLGQILTGVGTIIQSDTILFAVEEGFVPGRTAEPTSLSFNGRGIDLDWDGAVDLLSGIFGGTECTDTCEDVVGDFDAQP